MLIIRTTLETGINGIVEEYRKMYGIKIKDGYVSINDEIEIPINSIEKVQESQIEYEIKTQGVYINISKMQKSIKILVRC